MNPNGFEYLNGKWSDPSTQVNISMSPWNHIRPEQSWWPILLPKFSVWSWLEFMFNSSKIINDKKGSVLDLFSQNLFYNFTKYSIPSFMWQNKDEVSCTCPQYLHVFLHGFLENTLYAWMPTSPYSAVSLSESLGTLKFKLHLCLSSSQQQQQ